MADKGVSGQSDPVATEDLLDALAEASLVVDEASVKPVKNGVELTTPETKTFFPLMETKS